MLGNTMVSANTSPRRCASVRHAGLIGWSALITKSAPSNRFASRFKPARIRSTKNPTDDSAATATISATSKKRSSPARQSRWVILRDCTNMGARVGYKRQDGRYTQRCIGKKGVVPHAKQRPPNILPQIEVTGRAGHETSRQSAFVYSPVVGDN